MDNEVIVSAAHYEPELDVIIPCVRHADNIFYEHFILQCEKHPELDSIFWEQGFITNKRRYVDRNEAMVQWLYENKKGISYRDIESLEDNHECDYLGLKLIDIPLITSYGVLK